MSRLTFYTDSVFKFIVLVGFCLVPTVSQAQFIPIELAQIEDPSPHFDPDTDGVVSQSEFYEISRIIGEIYSPWAELRDLTHLAQLEVRANWSDNSLNSYASQFWMSASKRKWVVYLSGGLARRREVTEDAFAGIVCHEMGHHFAGFPFRYVRDISGNQNHPDVWAAAESEADYFATQDCFRRYVSRTGRSFQIPNQYLPSERVIDSCRLTWGSDEESFQICLRAASAGKALGVLLSHLNAERPVSFDTPDATIVDQTLDPIGMYPSSQCRLDTYLQGALCTKPFTSQEIAAVIPGRNPRSESYQKSIQAEATMVGSSCAGVRKFPGGPIVNPRDANPMNRPLGNRPLCWMVNRLFENN